MIANKRGQGLPLSTVIIAILVVLVLIVLVGFFLGGTSGLTKTIKSIFFGTTAGTDRVLAVQTCQQRCQQAEVLPIADRRNSAFCVKPFRVDTNQDGEPETYGGEEGKDFYVRYYCSPPSDPDNGMESLGVSCPEVAVHCEKQDREAATAQAAK